jgi:hypothetical protein
MCRAVGQAAAAAACRLTRVDRAAALAFPSLRYPRSLLTAMPRGVKPKSLKPSNNPPAKPGAFDCEPLKAAI